MNMSNGAAALSGSPVFSLLLGEGGLPQAGRMGDLSKLAITAFSVLKDD